MKNLTTLKSLLAIPLLAVALITPSVTIAQGAKPEKKVESYVDQMPEFKGGINALKNFFADNLTYPADAKANGVEGMVVISFVIDETGAVNDPTVLKKLGRGTDEEALRIVKLTSGKWTPGSHNGKIVPVKYTVPIKFSLTESERAATADKANQMPQFKGGQEALISTISKHLRLPEEAKQENLNAKVIVKFYVEKDGTVSNIRLEETKLKKTVGVGSDLDYMDASTFKVQNKAILSKLAEAATNAVKATSSKWQPALKNGQPTGAEMVLPVQFASSENALHNSSTDAPAMTKYTKDFYNIDEVDKEPTFKEGTIERFLAKNLRYPDVDFEGTVEAGLAIKEDGSMLGPLFYFKPTDTAEVNEAIFEEIRRVVKLTAGKWEPAKVDGKPVTVTKKLTIKFVINDGTKKETDKTDAKADVIVTKFK